MSKLFFELKLLTISRKIFHGTRFSKENQLETRQSPIIKIVIYFQKTFSIANFVSSSQKSERQVVKIAEQFEEIKRHEPI